MRSASVLRRQRRDPLGDGGRRAGRRRRRCWSCRSPPTSRTSSSSPRRGSYVEKLVAARDRAHRRAGRCRAAPLESAEPTAARLAKFAAKGPDVSLRFGLYPGERLMEPAAPGGRAAGHPPDAGRRRRAAGSAYTRGRGRRRRVGRHERPHAAPAADAAEGRRRAGAGERQLARQVGRHRGRSRPASAGPRWPATTPRTRARHDAGERRRASTRWASSRRAISLERKPQPGLARAHDAARARTTAIRWPTCCATRTCRATSA